MGKFLLKFILIILITFVPVVIFLSYFGIETDKFNDLIKNKVNEVNQNINLEFRTTKIYLNPTEFNFVVKLENPEILIRNNKIDLSKIDLFLSIKSFFSSDFLLKRAEIAFAKNDIKDLTKITNVFFFKIINKKIKKILSKGNLEGEFVIPFESDGSISKKYEFSGKISDATIYLTKEYTIKDLTAQIYRDKNAENQGIDIIIKKGIFFDLEFANSQINIKPQQQQQTRITSILNTRGKLNFSQLKKIASLLNFNISNIKNINGATNLKTKINFDINTKFQIQNLSYSVVGDFDHFEVHTDKKKVIQKYLPRYDSKIILKNTNIKFTNTESEKIVELTGLIKINEQFDSFGLKGKYNNENFLFNINGSLDLTNSEVKITRINYNKNEGIKSELIFSINFIVDKYYNIKNLNFLADKSRIHLSNMELNNNFELVDFKKIDIKTFTNEIKNNDFSINKNKEIIISGTIYDAEPLLKTLYQKNDKKIFSKNFKNKVRVNFNKTLTGTNDDVFDFAMIASINKGSYEKLSLKGKFSEEEIIEMSIYQVDKDKKTLQVISDRARPFVKNFDFIKGFEGGGLEYESIISKKGTHSNLLINDFKVSKVPALAQLLTLASLQGIADTLSGEGIRFETFEMKTNSKGNVLNIEEALAFGPAVSILLEGYVDKGKTVSLRGTLIPATKLNSIIASIPVVGDILVGQKTGEGVVGVSFKMKGPPKNIKTTVNPIKTLTPRFIVRAVEKMKKKKKNTTK